MHDYHFYIIIALLLLLLCMPRSEGFYISPVSDAERKRVQDVADAEEKKYAYMEQYRQSRG